MTHYTKLATGIHTWRCECGNHEFGYAYNDAFENWRTLNAGMFRHKFIEKGLLSETPPPQEPHVLMVSPADAHVLRERRWRVFPSRPRSRARFEVKGRLRGRALQRMLMPDSTMVRFNNRDGCDCRRENLKATSMMEVAGSRRILNCKDDSHRMIARHQ